MNLRTPCAQHTPSAPPVSPLRAYLTLAAEARRRGDHGEAAVYELDALRELRQQLAEARA